MTQLMCALLIFAVIDIKLHLFWIKCYLCMFCLFTLLLACFGGWKKKLFLSLCHCLAERACTGGGKSHKWDHRNESLIPLSCLEFFIP